MIHPATPTPTPPRAIHPSATRRDATPWTADADADAARMMRDNYLHRILHRSRAVASSRRRVVASSRAVKEAVGTPRR